jgi:hypothetical protein
MRMRDVRSCRDGPKSAGKNILASLRRVVRGRSVTCARLAKNTAWRMFLAMDRRAFAFASVRGTRCAKQGSEKACFALLANGMRQRRACEEEALQYEQ